jgi:hypothetical protein
VTEWGPIVAGPMATKFGAKKCPGCGNPITVGSRVCKVATEGKTTGMGQGPGRWMHAHCAARLAAPPPSDEDGAAQPALFDDH